jgi:hypothetical protein
MKKKNIKMGKNNFFKFLFQEKGNQPSKELSTIFNQMFPNAKNVEWLQKNDHFETIFYEVDIEKIAEFDKDGKCLLIKTNLNPLFFAGKLRDMAEKHGEIMNTIQIEKDNTIQYEIIVRDKDLTRFLLILDENGSELKFEKL